MKTVQKFVLDKKNEIVCRIVGIDGVYGKRYGFTLSVSEADPWYESGAAVDLDGYVSIAEAIRQAKMIWGGFRSGDEFDNACVKV